MASTYLLIILSPKAMLTKAMLLAIDEDNDKMMRYNYVL